VCVCVCSGMYSILLFNRPCSHLNCYAWPGPVTQKAFPLYRLSQISVDLCIYGIHIYISLSSSSFCYRQNRSTVGLVKFTFCSLWPAIFAFSYRKKNLSRNVDLLGQNPINFSQFSWKHTPNLPHDQLKAIRVQQM